MMKGGTLEFLQFIYISNWDTALMDVAQLGGPGSLVEPGPATVELAQLSYK